MRRRQGERREALKTVYGEYNEGEHTWDEGWLMDLHNLGLGTNQKQAFIMFLKVMVWVQYRADTQQKEQIKEDKEI